MTSLSEKIKATAAFLKEKAAISPRFMSVKIASPPKFTLLKLMELGIFSRAFDSIKFLRKDAREKSTFL